MESQASPDFDISQFQTLLDRLEASKARQRTQEGEEARRLQESAGTQQRLGIETTGREERLGTEKTGEQARRLAFLQGGSQGIANLMGNF